MINDLVHGVYTGINWLLKNIWWVVLAIFLAALSMGWFGFYELISSGNFEKEPFANFFKGHYYPNAFILAFLNLIVGHSDNLSNEKIIGAQALSYFALTITVILTLIKKWVAFSKRWAISKVSHSLVIGLGQNNRTYLLSEYAAKNHDNIIIIETDPNNIYIDQFRELGFGVFIGTLDEYKPKFSQLKNVVISTGVDQINIELAGKLIAKIPEKMSKEEFEENITVYIHIQNQDYKILFHQKILHAREGLPLEFKPYSFYDDAVRLLFEKHTLLGNYHELAKTDDPYSVIVVGSENLAERVIYHMCMLANLPNQNKLTVHCICEDAPKFLSRIKSNFPGIDEIKSSIELTGHSLCMNTPEFFESKLWVNEANLTNIFICHDDQNINSECAVNLHDKVYLQKAVEKKMKTKVHFAMYHGSEFRKSINENKDEYKEFYTFGDAKAICDRDHLINETHESISKLIHKGYGEVYDPELIIDLNVKEEVDELKKKWLDNTKFSDRESNRSQALHINTKLMSLGLQKIKVYDLNNLDKKKVDGLLDSNIIALKHFIEEFENEIKKDELIKFSCELGKPYRNPCADLDTTLIEKWFSKLVPEKSSFSKLSRNPSVDLNIELIEKWSTKPVPEKSSISKLMNAEHERWNAFHYLNGWTYAEEKKKEIKQHNCLIPLKKFNKAEMQMTIVYDLYSILYLPNYLASTGYRIVPLKDISIGVTGHINIKMNDKKLNECLKNELEKVMANYGNIELVSPLAEGSDRLFVDLAIGVDEQKIRKLTVPMPFEKKDYKEDFNDKSQKQFDSFWSKGRVSVDAYSLTNGEKRSQKSTNDFIEKAYKSIDDLYKYLEEEGYEHVYKLLEELYKESKNLQCVNNKIPSLPSIKCLDDESFKKHLESFKQKISELETSDIQTEYDNEQYKKTGKEVVDKSDILFAIWDGEKAKGKGGTAEIVDYAISKNKKVIWINPNTYHVDIM